MKTKLDEVLTEDQRLSMWSEMMALATAMLDFCDSWWDHDPGIARANNIRFTLMDPDDLE